ncbi:MAG: hypothetical protein ORN85_06465 [Sediminibacterium sp.]|nr:hypothetical protein [Sediminibacterium sp.]
MAINKNHEVEEINGVRCAIVEKEITYKRCEFLRKILDENNYKVYIQNMNTAAKLNNIEDSSTPENLLYKIGVDDLSFNVINAIFGRLLKDSYKNPITLEFWNQQIENNSNHKPYFY